MWNPSNNGANAITPPESSTAFQRLSNERGSGRSGTNSAWDRTARQGSGRGAPTSAAGAASSGAPQGSLSPNSTPSQSPTSPTLRPGVLQLPSPGGGRIPVLTSPEQEAKRTNLKKISFNGGAGGRKGIFPALQLQTGGCTVGVMSDIEKRERGKFLIMNAAHSAGKLKFDSHEFDFVAEDLVDLGEIGRGNFGTVNKMTFSRSSPNKVMAVKRIRSTVDEKEQKQLLMDLEVVMKSSDCPFIVTFFGAIFQEGDCWICMELMHSR